MQALLDKQDFWILVIAILWTLPWKGYALWTASQRNNKKWFIALIIFNTFGILEIFYVFYIAKKTPRDIWQALNSKV